LLKCFIPHPKPSPQGDCVAIVFCCHPDESGDPERVDFTGFLPAQE